MEGPKTQLEALSIYSYFFFSQHTNTKGIEWVSEWVSEQRQVPFFPQLSLLLLPTKADEF